MSAGGVRAMIAGMPASEYWLFTAALLAGAIWMLRRAIAAFWRLRLIADTPTARIRTASQGYLELSGIARSQGAAIAAPLTKTPCAWFRFRVEKRRSSGRNHRWVTVKEGTSDEPFVLEDVSGRCLVYPAGAHMPLCRRQRWFGDREDQSSRNGARGWLDAGWLGIGIGNRYRFTEERIQVGDPIYLLGRFETPRRGQEERERLERALLQVWKRDPGRMQQIDRDGDGEVSVAEWERARREAADLAAHSEDRLIRMPALSRVLDPGDPRQPYLISTRSEQELTASLRWQVFGLTAGCIALAAGAGYGLILRLASS